ncbi:MAG: TerB family tellurite resistance protein [SAR324 cluster bacterium]|nr:TerB family tellurite resistance protein [SAR324 cluster bacterium]
MAQSLVELLPPKVKVWFAHAVAGLITADGVVTESELVFLRETINFLENVDEINQVVGEVKNKERPVLQTINTDSNTAAMILIHLASIAIADGSIDQAEVDYFKYVGKKLGFDPAYSEEILQWGKDSIMLEKRKKGLVKRAKKNKIF